MSISTLTPRQQQTIINTYNYVKKKLADDYSGHDITHIERVVKLAQHIQATEADSNAFIVIMSAYLHDVIDDKVFENSELARHELIEFMQQQSIEQPTQHAIMMIIDNMSFSKNLDTRQPLSKEGKIVQDADRLDAIGAIGIARTFYYGGNKQHIMYDPNIEPRAKISKEDYRKPSSVINHFYEKLLLLKDQINTTEGKKIAAKRHQLLINFIQEFKNEWSGNISV